MGFLQFNSDLIIILFFFSSIIIPPVWGYRAGSKRTIGAVLGLLLGFFLSIIGIIIIYLTPRIDEHPLYGFNNHLNNQSGADELKKYKQLLDDGAITEAEHHAQKAKIFNGQF